MIALMRIAVFIAILYLIYFFYKALRKPAVKKVARKAAPGACPSPKVFIDYTKGRIKGKQKKTIDKHIAHCKNCQDALKDVFDISKKEVQNEKA